MKLKKLLASLAFLAGAAAPGAAATADFKDLKDISHADWTVLLEKFVDQKGMVGYKALLADAESKAKFDRYVALVENVGPKTHPQLFPTRQDELAYYINAYNALTWKGVIERGPEDDSVWKGAISGYNFFIGMKMQCEGEKISLRDLENDVVRAKYKDPRIHAALNCASIGCPLLRREAYEGAKLDAQLDEQVKIWVNDDYHVKPDPASKKAAVNKIFDWFTGDFVDHEKSKGAAKPAVLGWINRYRPADRQIPVDFKLEINDYDKRVNKQ
jgi:Protein of unknown function, DUF547